MELQAKANSQIQTAPASRGGREEWGIARIGNSEATRCSKCFEKSYRAAKPVPMEPDRISRSRWAWNTADMFPGAVRQEDGRIDARYNLVELSTSPYPARTRRNIEESDGTVIFSIERLLSGGTKLTLGHANKVGKPVLHIYDTRKKRISNPDSLRLEVQALTDFLRSNNIEVLNVAGP